MKARTVLKWAIGVIALLAVAALAGAVWLFVAFYLDMEKGEQHRRRSESRRCRRNDLREHSDGSPRAFPANAQAAAYRIRDALGLGRETRDRPANLNSQPMIKSRN